MPITLPGTDSGLSAAARKKRKAGALLAAAGKLSAGGAGAAARVAGKVRLQVRRAGQAVTTQQPPQGEVYSYLDPTTLPQPLAAALANLRQHVGTSPVYAVRTVQKVNYKGRKDLAMLWVTPLYLVLTDVKGCPKRVVRLEVVSSLRIDDVRSSALMTPTKEAWDRPWMWYWEPDPPPSSAGSLQTGLAAPKERHRFIGALEFARRPHIPPDCDDLNLPLDRLPLIDLPQGMKYNEAQGMRPADEKLRNWLVPDREGFMQLHDEARLEADDERVRAAMVSATADLDVFQRMAKQLLDVERRENAIYLCVLAACIAVSPAEVAVGVRYASAHVSELRASQQQLTAELGKLVAARDTAERRHAAILGLLLSDVEAASGINRQHADPTESLAMRGQRVVDALSRQAAESPKRWGRLRERLLAVEQRNAAAPHQPDSRATSPVGTPLSSVRSAHGHVHLACAGQAAERGAGERPLSPLRHRPPGQCRPLRLLYAPPGWRGTAEPMPGLRPPRNDAFVGRRPRRGGIAEAEQRDSLSRFLARSELKVHSVEWLRDGRALLVLPFHTPLPPAVIAAGEQGARLWRDQSCGGGELDVTCALLPEMLSDGFRAATTAADIVAGRKVPPPQPVVVRRRDDFPPRPVTHGRAGAHARHQQGKSQPTPAELLHRLGIAHGGESRPVFGEYRVDPPQRERWRSAEAAEWRESVVAALEPHWTVLSGFTAPR
eukprot:TRINITY_DN18520_c0_g1_i4.p1 TRINITY_DN18520_c0_g1~~TRINITY_DN18520_c0_g1_i4.p1  ORF type:complete len:735 (+),score=187.25 TRINITY_DN18520_c0_g1_i4:51-2207(+)